MSGGFVAFVYTLLDQFLILFMISPCATMVWRGSWKLFDEFLFPNQLLISAWVSICIGYSFTIVTFLFTEMKNSEWKLFEKYKEWRIFMYPLSISVLHGWRGCWMLLDYYTPINGLSLLLSHVLSFAILSVTKTASNSMFIPSFFVSDNCVTPFQIGTAFGTACTNVSPVYKVLDYAWTMTVITMSTVAFWRSSWEAINIYLFPGHPAFSNLLSMLGGYTVIISFKLVDHVLKSLVKRKKSKIFGFVVQVFFSYTMGFAAINLWRGAWELADIYLFPDHLVIVGLASHSFGMFVLYLSGTVSNLIGCPCGTRVDSLETLSAFDTTVGTILTWPKDGYDTSKRNEFTERKQLVISTTPDSSTTTLKIIEVK